MGNETMTPRQIELARHALGLPARFKQSYRNRFIAGRLHPDFADWQQMVEAGDAERSAKSHATGECWTYRLTLQGAHSALLKGESLDLEDFPSAASEAA
jgi:hypothetical protein